MADLLRKVLFSPQLLPAVQGFFCGNEPWEAPLAQWITAGPEVKHGALAELTKRKGKLQIWLHVSQADELVGYSSLGESKWPWPLPEAPRVPISIVPNVAIQKKFQGLPSDGPRYSAQIMEHLIYEAVQHFEREPLLGLYVDPRNVGAIKVYQRHGFENFSQTYHNPDDGVTYQGMLLKLVRQTTRE